MFSDEAERLREELTAAKEAKAIAKNKTELGFTDQIDAEEEIFRREYPEHQYLLNLHLEQIKQHVERLERDMMQVKDDDLFSDIMDSERNE